MQYQRNVHVTAVTLLTPPSSSFPVIEIHHRLSRANSSFTPENSEGLASHSSSFRRLSYVDGIAIASGMGGMAFASRESFSRRDSISGRSRSISGGAPGVPALPRFHLLTP